MKYATEMASGVTIHIPRYMKIGTVGETGASC
jgi:hypothetical protein